MHEQVIKRSKAFFESSKSSFARINEDDAFMDICCFQLQQSIEMCLKYIVEMSGSKYAENPDIRAQLNRLNNLKVNIPFESELRSFASTLNEWKASSRYKDSFIAVLQDVETLLKIGQGLLEFAESFSKETENEVDLKSMSSFDD